VKPAAIIAAATLGTAAYVWWQSAQASQAPADSSSVDNPDPQNDTGGFDFSSLLGSVGLGGSDMHLSDAGLQALAQREGFSATPYWDHKGYSIGYGHLIKSGENLTNVTRDQAAQLLMQDVGWAEQAVANNVTVPLSQNQFDALVSFAFNVGAGAFASSTLVKQLNAGDYNAPSEQLPRWNKASGVINGALVSRRASEISQFYA
jgi:GH24 family phage-related lysozyme (muramidase)